MWVEDFDFGILKSSAEEAQEIYYYFFFLRGAKFCWLALWILEPEWHSRMLKPCDVGQTLWWSSGAWGRVRAVLRLCNIPWHSPYNWGKITEKTQVRRKMPSWIGLSTIRCVDLATIMRAASSGLLTSASKVGSLMVCHCLLSRFFRRFKSWIRTAIGAVGRFAGDFWE